MNRKMILGLWVLAMALLLPAAGFGALYKYTDQDGQVHYTDRPDRVPAEYRDQVQKVQKEINVEQSEPQEKPEKKFGAGESTWQQLVVFDKNNQVVGVDLRKLLRRSLLKSGLIVWLALELVLLILALILLFRFRNWPTQAGRRNSAIAVIAGYLVSSLAIFFFLLLPAAHKFFSLSEVYLTEIRTNLGDDPSAQQLLDRFEDQLSSYQDKLP